MLRPPLVLSIIAASCLTFFAHIASAQPGWDEEGGGGAESSASGSSEASPTSEGGASGATESDDFSDPTAGAAAPTSDDPDAEFGEVSEEELDERLETLGNYLKDIQAPLRSHTTGWLLLNGGLAGFFGYQASYEHSAVRASAIMRSTLS